VTTNATRLVDDFGPFHRAIWRLFEHATPLSGLARANYITRIRKQNMRLLLPGR